MRFDDSEFRSDKALHAYLSKHSAQIIANKRAEKKLADAHGGFLSTQKERVATKANNPIENPSDILQVKAVINTTNLYDSHGDVHISGLWTKSLSEYKFMQHLQEHRNNFSSVISDGADLKAYALDTTFGALGFDYKGATQALVFESSVRKDRNEFMHNQYAQGWVNQHSVGMQYVKLFTCIDDKDYKEEYANWAKYIDQVANREDIRRGYFYAVTEAKALEGSAVTLGSNHATPTINNNGEPSKHSLVTEPTPVTRSKVYYPIY